MKAVSISGLPILGSTQLPDLSIIGPFAIMVVIAVFLGYQVAGLYKDKIDLIKELVQANNNVDMLSERLSEVGSKQDLVSGSQDDFVKFLSDSREDAFSFIAEVQGGITSLKNAMDAKDDTEIAKSYQELLRFLPEDMVE